MKNLLTIICCFGALSMIAQVPGYVPQDGLVAWYPFNANFFEHFSNEQGMEVNVTFIPDRSGVESSALQFNNNGSVHYNSGPWMDWSDENSWSISCWFSVDEPHHGSVFEKWFQASSNPYPFNLRVTPVQELSAGMYPGFTDGIGVVGAFVLNTWTHAVSTYDAESRVLSLYVNGVLASTEILPEGDYMNADPLYIGRRQNESTRYFRGGVDDLAFFDRVLSLSEVQNLAADALLTPGCTDETSCNFNSEATIDDGSCDYVTCLCLDGTIWSEELGGCIPATTCPQDLDYDGVVGVNDLMNLLSAFGTPCEPPAAASTCGEPVTYRGYDYETVLIGDKCWFAENLRATKYLNGAEIENLQGGPIWMNANEGVTGGWVDFANDTIYGALHGKMYNGYAVTDERGLCPPEWHVSTDLEWDEMIQSYGGEQLAGTALKDDELWNGDNTSGFSGLAGGFRDWGNAVFFDFGWTVGTWWTVNHETGTIGTTKRLIEESGLIYSFGFPETNGSYVRCIKD